MMIKARKFPGLFLFLGLWLYLKYLDYMGDKKNIVS